jgi:ribosomal protein S18 acetylase RimI-like enzyme
MYDSEVSVRSLAIEDLEQCGTLIAESSFFRGYGVSGDAIARELRETLADARADVRVACCDGEVLGFAWLESRAAFARSGYLRLIVVADSGHGRGIGRALMSELEQDHLAPHGVVLLVTASNEEARHFYEALGYRCVGSMPDYVKSGTEECIYYKAGS